GSSLGERGCPGPLRSRRSFARPKPDHSCASKRSRDLPIVLGTSRDDRSFMNRPSKSTHVVETGTAPLRRPELRSRVHHRAQQRQALEPTCAISVSTIACAKLSAAEVRI